MRFIIDIGHPAHVHLFRNLGKELEKNSHLVIFTYREKECTEELLKYYNLNIKRTGRNYNSLFNKILGVLTCEFRLIKICRKFRPDVFISHGSFYAAWVAFLFRKPHISLEDTGNMEQVRLYRPFTAVILTSTSFASVISNKQLYYPGYHELAYLHPIFFKADQDYKKVLTNDVKQKIIVLRFVKRSASHDTGQKNMTGNMIMMMINMLQKFGQILISSEFELNENLKKYAYRDGAEKFHQLLASANIVIGNSATVASEAAILGIPSILVENKGRFYTDELEKRYNLVLNFPETPEGIEKAIKNAINILTDPVSLPEWLHKKNIMLSEKINLTGFLAWFVENYPRSIERVKNDSNIYNNFK